MALPQPLHIVRKDLIHLWPETLFVVLLFVCFAAAAPSGWSGSQYAVYITVLAWLLRVLMPISWLVLITRSIQDESLVGDRQFWTSRPYHWAKLLAAKAIFILICIYVPFFIMQCYLLKHAGLHPLMVIPGLLHNLLLLTVVLIIPLAALAAVTSTFPRLLLTFIGAIIYIVVLLGIIGWITFLRMQPPHLNWILNTIFIGVPALVLLLQYKTRKTTLSRVILAATPLLAGLILLLVPTNALVDAAYPLLSRTGTPSLAPFSDKLNPPPVTGALNTLRENVNIILPIAVSGVEKDSTFVSRGSRLTVTAPGVSYTSPFLASNFPTNLAPERPVTFLAFAMPVDIFNKIHLAPADIHIELASEHYKTENPSSWKATLLPFSIPGNGLCSFPTQESDGEFPTCRYPFGPPDISFVTAQLAAGSCTTPAAPPATGQASLGGSGASLDFDPVVTVPLSFQTGDPDPQHNYVLCAGTPLNFVEARKLPNARLMFDQKQVILDPYASRVSAHPNRRGRPQPPPDQQQ